MTVVTDTSVVLNLCLIGQQELLRLLYGKILAPTMVVVEFQRLAVVDARFQGLAFPDFIEKAAPLRLLPALTASSRLDAGEVAALSLAVERQADAVLMESRLAVPLRPPSVCERLACWGCSETPKNSP